MREKKGRNKEIKEGGMGYELPRVGTKHKWIFKTEFKCVFVFLVLILGSPYPHAIGLFCPLLACFYLIFFL